ncbi:YxeA family protein [Mammaliicoccus sp. Dog046]|uniref:YxeA family protein n=1 Tax=Mammaliicoccus sp. Dog046 TaxID=3034233 RepID=UPI002B256864|nr:YxeA family protein [Mammaliicoccus sp. Dog046]WQK84905.1 YxeA family protein [Mammaliicoccus sp. Dog046]
MKKWIYSFIIIVFAVFSLFVLRYLEPYLDRVNPLVEKQWSYAEVPFYKDAESKTREEIIEIQDYKNITSYDEEGNKNRYKLSFKGHDPSGQFVKIEHKGKYVFFIEYITKKEFERKVSK